MPENADPRTAALDAVIAELKKHTDANGRISFADAAILLDKWQSEVTFGGRPMSELAEAVDMPDEWHGEFMHPVKAAADGWEFERLAWCWVLGVLAVVYGVWSHTAWMVVAGAAFASVVANRLGKVRGRAAGYSDGLQKGYVTAVFWQHGIPPDRQREFGEHCHEARADRHIADGDDDSEHGVLLERGHPETRFLVGLDLFVARDEPHPCCRTMPPCRSGPVGGPVPGSLWMSTVEYTGTPSSSERAFRGDGCA